MSPAVQAASIAAWSDEEHVVANRALYRDKFAAGHAAAARGARRAAARRRLLPVGRRARAATTSPSPAACSLNTMWRCCRAAAGARSARRQPRRRPHPHGAGGRSRRMRRSRAAHRRTSSSPRSEVIHDPTAASTSSTPPGKTAPTSSAQAAPKEVREAVEHVIADLNDGRLRVAERQGVGQWTVNQWVKKAVLLSLPPERQRARCSAGDLGFYDKVPTKFAHLDEAADARHRRARRAAGGGAPRQLHRQERGPDAELREHRRLRRRRHDGRHLGHRRLVRADRQERAPVGRRRHRRRARAAAGQPDHHRGQLLHRRPLRGRRRRDRRGELGASRWACTSARAPRSTTAPPAR